VAGCAALGLAACVFGFRGEIDFADEVTLDRVETVQLYLPTTNTLILTGQPDRTSMSWSGRWVTLGGSSDDSLRSARKASLVWETWETIGRLRPDLPLEIRDITLLEQLDVDSASNLAHEIVGTGDVFVSGIDAYLSIRLGGGNVQVDGGDDQLVVRTSRGNVDLATAAAVDVASGVGTIELVSEASADIVINANGPVYIELVEVDDLDIDIAAAGPIVVQLDTATHVGAGSYRRSLGEATRRLWVRSNGGRVELHMIDAPAAPDPDPDPVPDDPLP